MHSNSDDDTGRLRGIPSYANWIAAREGEDLRGTAEIDLYTDANVVGEIRSGVGPDFGPYKLLNVVGGPAEYGVARRQLVLRFDDHYGLYFEPDTRPLGSETDESSYHGGNIADEIAALLALILGCRIQAGNVSREFDPDGDPKGKPRWLFGEYEPQIGSNVMGQMLPSISGRKSLDDANLVACLPDIESSATVALVRAARMYQEAVWRADPEPELAWLLLVSAVETAADFHYTDEPEPVELFWDRKEGLAEQLEDVGGEEAVRIVADEFAMVMQGTKKFIDFTLEFKPDEPKVRPPSGSGARIRWSNTGFRENMGMIYGYRSKALHAGKPFPAPMCVPPTGSTEWDAVPETLVGRAMGVGENVWTADDIPMHLRMFEYIARGCLTNWWEKLEG